jgi:hypothetical protein
MSGPITPHGAVIVNAAYDFAQYSKAIQEQQTPWPGDNAFQRIHKKELVFRHRDSNKRKRSSYNEPDLKVFSVCNGLHGSGEEDARKLCTFIGVSNTDLEVASQRHASITIAGLTTITNTGPGRIDPGDKIVWDVASSTGGAGRKTFSIHPYKHAQTKMMTKFNKDLESATTNTSSGETDADCCADALKAWCRHSGLSAPVLVAEPTFMHFLNCYSKMCTEVDSRVIGTAMSKAESNQQIDILVRHSH